MSQFFEINWPIRPQTWLRWTLGGVMGASALLKYERYESSKAVKVKQFKVVVKTNKAQSIIPIHISSCFHVIQGVHNDLLLPEEGVVVNFILCFWANFVLVGHKVEVRIDFKDCFTTGHRFRFLYRHNYKIIKCSAPKFLDHAFNRGLAVRLLPTFGQELR